MTTATKKIRWGVLGSARIAREHLIPAMQRSANSEFTALATRGPAKLAESRSQYPAVKIHASYEDLLLDKDVDAIYIPLPNALHREWSIRAMEHGKHVLCEKPIALNAAECRDMIAAATSNKVKLMEAFMYRYTQRTRQVREILRSGVLGEIKFVSSTFRYLLTGTSACRQEAGLGGGSLYDVGCYPVNFVGLVTDEIAGKGPGQGALPESLSVESIKSGGVDVIFSAAMKYPTGMIASINCGFNAQRRWGSEIVGTRGALEVPDTFFDNAGNLTLTIGDERREIAVEKSDRYRHEVEDFADAILKGRTPEFTLAETLRNMEVLDRLFAADQI